MNAAILLLAVVEPVLEMLVLDVVAALDPVEDCVPWFCQGQ
jgi:hypothetical protein